MAVKGKTGFYSTITIVSLCIVLALLSIIILFFE
ncbi:hypothetical protein JOD43_000523 [Pullulanibacillus pueri]|nr:hypothetical protein [Pullulanibacillus pueri]